MEQGRFSEADREALRQFLAQQDTTPSTDEPKNPEVELTPEQVARFNLGYQYVSHYFGKFAIGKEGLVPHAQRMRVTLPMWMNIAKFTFQYPDGRQEIKKVNEVYPDFGTRDIISASGYFKTQYEKSRDNYLPGTDEYRNDDQLARYWGVVSDMAVLATQMDQGPQLLK